MPGPMGGGHGGGFSGGSRGGGGGPRGGGGFHGGGPRGPMHHGPMHHGPHHHGPRPMFFGPMFHRRRYYGGGGGCLGNIIGSIIAIPILICFFGIMIFTMCTGDFTLVEYDEQKFQQYADDQYYAAFSDAEDYEGNILLVFLTYESTETYDCIAWGGYNIDSETEELFGSYFQSTVDNKMPKHYENALTKSLRDIVNTMASAAPENSAGATDTSHSKLVNNTSLQIDKNTVNTALQSFTEKTGYPIAIVVEDAEEVFGVEGGNGGGSVDMIALVLAAAVIIILIVIVVKKSNNKNGGGNGGSSSDKTDKTNPDAGQGKYDPNTGTWV